MDWSQRVAQVVEQRNAASEPILKMITELKRDKTLSDSVRNKYLTELFETLSDKDITQGISAEANAYEMGTSFRASMNDLRRSKQALRNLGIRIFPGGLPRFRDRSFGRALGVAVPRTYQKSVPLNSVALKPETILRPTSGNALQNVFYIDHSRHIHSLKSRTVFHSLNELDAKLTHPLESGPPKRWSTEEAVLSAPGRLANAWHIYCFYGEAVLFIEVDRLTFSGTRYAPYWSTGQQTELGPSYRSFEGNGLAEGLKEVAEKISLAAPVPFLRLGVYHDGEGNILLDEITPHPGEIYAADLHAEVDKRLGRHFTEARARLFRDLFNGKAFPEFRFAYGVH